MYSKLLLVFFILFSLLLPFSADSANLFAPPIPARIGGSVTVDGTSLTQATDDGYTFTVTKQDGSAYVDLNGVPAQDLDGFNTSDWYLIDIPIYDAADQPGGGNPGDTAVIHVFKDGSEFSVTSPINGQFILDQSGSTTQIDLEVITAVNEVEAFVTRFYQLCLGRNPDTAGLDGWVNALSNGSQTGSDVAYGFVFSQEFLNQKTTNEAYLTVLYEAFFNRDPDQGGWNGWLDALNRGESREHVLRGFIYAIEFNNLCWDYGISPNPIAAFVTRFYQLCLNRSPERAGLDGWTNELLSRTRTGSDVAFGFVFSQEFLEKNTSNEDYLTILYDAFFDRQPDQTGWDTWLAELDGGKVRLFVLNGFIYSKEFSDLCRKFGITPFSDPDVDSDGDGFSRNQGDCNDIDPNTYPGASEATCSDGTDQDCDGYDLLCQNEVVYKFGNLPLYSADINNNPTYSTDHYYSGNSGDTETKGIYGRPFLIMNLNEIAETITKVKVKMHLQRTGGPSWRQLQFRIYKYDLDTGESISLIHENTWPPTGNTPPYLNVSSNLTSYETTIICDTNLSRLSSNESLVIYPVCHHYGSGETGNEIYWDFHFDSLQYPSQVEVFAGDSASTIYYFRDAKAKDTL